MSNVYEIDSAHRLVYWRSNGLQTIESISKVRRALDQDARFDPTFSFLVDLTDANLAGLSADDVWHLAMSRNNLAPDARIVVIAPKDDQYGLARMYEIRRSLDVGDFSMLACRT